MQHSTVEQVEQFHLLFEHPIGSLNGAEPLSIRQLRIKLLFEELQELAEAGDVMNTFFNLCNTHVGEVLGGEDVDITNGEPDITDGNNVDRVEELDALCDIQYVLDGKKLTSGLYEVFEEAFKLVHMNNMQKAHRSPEHVAETSNKNGITLNCVERNGVYVAIRPDGKVTKPWDHKKVDISHLIPVAV